MCAGGSTVDAETFLTQLYDQIHVGGADGNATGRNIHQRSLDEAVLGLREGIARFYDLVPDLRHRRQIFLPVRPGNLQG